MTRQESANTVRNGAVDALRGVAIIAVVLGHANIGVVSAGLTVGEDAQFFSTLNIALYLVHMPLFAFLMGLSMPVAWEKRPHPQYLLQRVVFFGWLYLLWTLIQGSFEVLASRFQHGNKTTISDVLSPWVPIAHLWFLPWAMIVSLLILGTQPWKKRPLSLIVGVLTLAISSGMWGVDGDLFFTRGMALLIFTLVGAVTGMERFSRWIQGFSAIKAGLLISSWAVYLGILILHIPNERPTTSDGFRSLATVGTGILASIAGITAIILTISLIYRLCTVKWLEYLGRMSLQIFLAHLLFTPATRIMLIKLGITDPFFVDGLATTAGICGALLLFLVTRNRLPWLFQPPRQLMLSILQK